MAVVWSVTECCRPYLCGSKFIVVTDHEALRWLLSLKEPRGRLARWALKLMSYDFEIITRPGRLHSVPDALSRLPSRADVICFIRSLPAPDRVMPIRQLAHIEGRSGHELPSEEDFRQAYLQHDWCKSILNYFESNAAESERREADKFEDYVVENGVIYKLDYVPRENMVLGFRVVVPRTLAKRLLEYYHGALPNGHLGMVKTYDRVRQAHYWKGMQKDVYQYVSLCDTCLRVQQRKPPKQATLKSIAPSRRFELVAMDILKLKETHHGHHYALVMTDMFTKFSKVAPLRDIEAIIVAEAFADDWLSTFAAPEKILTDQGGQFTGDLFLSLCRLIEVKKLFSAAYHPQTDGVVERNNQTLIKMLSMFVATDQKNWDDILSMVTYAHNTAVHSTTGQTPYKMMFGAEAPELSPEAYRLQLPYRDVIDSDSPLKFRQALAQAHHFARRAMKKPQSYYKRYYDKNVIITEFVKGDLAYLWQPVTKKGGSRKLTAPWRGPFRIKERINERNVILGIPSAKGEITIRVHINRLRKASEALFEATPLAIGPIHENLPEGHYFVDRIVGVRKMDGREEFKVRWVGWSRKYDTWEPELSLPPIIVNEFRAEVRAKRAQRDSSQ